MNKINLWFVYEHVMNKEELSSKTKKVIGLIKEFEKQFSKELFDLRSIEYNRFIPEHGKETSVKKEDLPVVLINKKIVFKHKFPSSEQLKKEIERLMSHGK